MAGNAAIPDPSTLTEYGLGYGVDVTALSERRDVVRQATDVKLHQGLGAFEYYYRVSQSGREVSLKGSTTLAANLLTAGVGGGLSRGTSQVSVEVGRRTLTRTYYFSKDTHRDFEDTLREKVKFDEVRNNEDSLLENCKTYLERDLKCTHYVKSIMMGAVEYEVMTLEEYNRTFSFLGSIGAKMQEFGIVASSQFSKEVKRRHEELGYTKVGSWDDSYHVLEEKVIDVKLAPIHELINTNPLKKAFKEAVVQYRKERINGK